jgi:hypothetical protein
VKLFVSVMGTVEAQFEISLSGYEAGRIPRHLK